MIILRHVRLSIVLITLVFYPGLGWADSWQQDGSVGVTTEYNTNPTMIPDYRNGVWQYIFAPSYTLKRTGDLNEFRAGIALRISRSSNIRLIQNRNNPSAYLSWDRLAIAGKFGIAAKYDETSTLYSEIDNKGTLLPDSNRTSRSITGNWEKALSERSTLSADGAYEGVTYSNTDYTNYVTRSGDVMFKYDLSERNKPYVKISYADYEPSNGISTFAPGHYTNTALGLNWVASEFLSGKIQAGKANVSGAGMIGTQELAIQYTGQRTGLALNESRQVVDTGLGGIIIVEQANGNLRYALNETNLFGVDLVRQKSHYIDEVISSTSGAWLQHDINSFWGTRTYYLHRIVSQVGVGRAYSDTVGFSLTYTIPNF